MVSLYVILFNMIETAENLYFDCQETDASEEDMTESKVAEKNNKKLKILGQN